MLPKRVPTTSDIPSVLAVAFSHSKAVIRSGGCSIISRVLFNLKVKFSLFFRTRPTGKVRIMIVA